MSNENNHNHNHFPRTFNPELIILENLVKENPNEDYKILKITNFPRVREPYIFFGEIIINGIKYFQYVCYSGNNPYHNHYNNYSVVFRELIKTSKNNKNVGLFRNILADFQKSKKKLYLYFIKIENISIYELKSLLDYIEQYRRIKRNNTFCTKIYNYIKKELESRRKNKRINISLRKINTVNTRVFGLKNGNSNINNRNL